MAATSEQRDQTLRRIRQGGYTSLLMAALVLFAIPIVVGGPPPGAPFSLVLIYVLGRLGMIVVLIICARQLFARYRRGDIEVGGRRPRTLMWTGLVFVGLQLVPPLIWAIMDSGSGGVFTVMFGMVLGLGAMAHLYQNVDPSPIPLRKIR